MTTTLIFNPFEKADAISSAFIALIPSDGDLETMPHLEGPLQVAAIFMSAVPRIAEALLPLALIAVGKDLADAAGYNVHLEDDVLPGLLADASKSLLGLDVPEGGDIEEAILNVPGPRGERIRSLMEAVETYTQITGIWGSTRAALADKHQREAAWEAFRPMLEKAFSGVARQVIELELLLAD